MNELEEWETIYKEIVCNRITYFHFSHSLRFLFILAVKRYKKKRQFYVMTQEIKREDTLCPRTRYRNILDHLKFLIEFLWSKDKYTIDKEDN